MTLSPRAGCSGLASLLRATRIARQFIQASTYFECVTVLREYISLSFSPDLSCHFSVICLYFFFLCARAIEQGPKGGLGARKGRSHGWTGVDVALYEERDA